MAIRYTDVAFGQNEAKTNSSKMITYASEVQTARGVITFVEGTAAADVVYIEEVKKGAIFDWAGSTVLSEAAAVAGTIGLVNAAGVFTAKGTLTSASNVGRFSAPTNISHTPTTEACWVAYTLSGTPPTSGTAKFSVPYVALSH